MPNLNLDEFSEKMFGPIKVTIGGMEYTAPKVTSDILDKVSAAAKDEKTKALCYQLSDILGVEKKTFLDTDIRIVAVAVKFIQETISNQIESETKNFIVAGENTTPRSSTPSPAPSPSTT